MEMIRQRLKERGDMPIFSASVNRVHKVSSDPEADAMALSVEILKDANLTAKVLKLANSPMYNRGVGKISNLSRAVVVLGFDTVKSVVITLKLIDSFQQEHPHIDMTGMLVNSLISGGFVRGVSAKCGIKDIEQVYICGLLNNLGEIVTAYALPEQYCEIQKLRQEQGLSKTEAEKQVLGITIRKLGQEVAKDWEFPSNVIKTMEEQATGKGMRIRNELDLTGALTTLSGKTLDLLYAENPDTNLSLAELTYEISKVAGIKKEDVSGALENAFKQTCDLAQDYGLRRKHLTPKLRVSGDEDLEKVSRQFSFYASSEISTKDVYVETEVVKPKPREDKIVDVGVSTRAEKTIAPAGDPNALLGIMFEITTMMSQKAAINAILSKVLEGIHRGLGFDRAVLCLLTPDHKSYIGRLAEGVDIEALKAYLSFPVNTQHDLFSKIIMEGKELLVSDITESGWQQQLPPDFVQRTGARAFILGALRSKSRPLGLFYADNAASGRKIGAEERRGFSQLIAQAQLAFQVR